MYVRDYARAHASMGYNRDQSRTEEMSSASKLKEVSHGRVKYI